jgi:hypothetical protein
MAQSIDHAADVSIEQKHRLVFADSTTTALVDKTPNANGQVAKVIFVGLQDTALVL